VVDLHVINPLHRVEVRIFTGFYLSTYAEAAPQQEWNRTFFEPTTLKKIGLRIQLGHRAGDLCANPNPASGDDFVVVDTNGVHQVGLDYCNCEQAEEHGIQLLRARWYPATTTAPKSAPVP
jgi:hypothetical protein